MMAFASVIEPLRAANLIADCDCYSWSIVGLTKAPIRASNGIMIPADFCVAEQPNCDRLVVCSGGDAEVIQSQEALTWMRRVARGGAALGAVADGAFFLARAGLLDGYRCTLHWTSQPAFSESFREIILERSHFVIDRGRFTSLGGIGCFDMMLAFIEKDHDTALALAVADWFAHSPFKSSPDRLPMDLRLRTGIRNRLVLACVADMETEDDTRPSVSQLAQKHGVSQDTLVRAFRAELGQTPGQYWRQIRLRRAHGLLLHSTLTVSEIAVSCGYLNASAFGRAFHKAFGVSPREARGPYPTILRS